MRKRGFSLSLYFCTCVFSSSVTFRCCFKPLLQNQLCVCCTHGATLVQTFFDPPSLITFFPTFLHLGSRARFLLHSLLRHVLPVRSHFLQLQHNKDKMLCSMCSMYVCVLLEAAKQTTTLYPWPPLSSLSYVPFFTWRMRSSASASFFACKVYQLWPKKVQDFKVTLFAFYTFNSLVEANETFIWNILDALTV